MGEMAEKERQQMKPHHILLILLAFELVIIRATLEQVITMIDQQNAAVSAAAR